MTRIDYYINEKHTVFGRHLQTYGPRGISAGSFSHQNRATTQHRGNSVLNWTYVIDPTLMNDARLTFERQLGKNDNADKSFSISGLGFLYPPGETNETVPNVGISGYTGIGHGQQGFAVADNAFDVANNLSKVWGNHTLKAGAQFQKIQSNFLSVFLTSGFYSFSGSFTGNGLADFLLGRASSFGQFSPTQAGLRGWALHNYVQDDWKVSPKLTVNLGLRYEFWTPNRELRDIGALFIPREYARGTRSRRFPDAPKGYFFPGDPNIPRWLVKDDTNNFAPRVGLAYDLFGDGRWAIRVGGGIFYSNIMLGRTVFFQQPPFILSVGINDTDLANPYARAPGGRSPFPFDISKPYPWASAMPLGIRTVNEAYKSPYSSNWNFTIEHELARGYLLSLSYIGTKGTNLPSGEGFNPAICTSPNPTRDCTIANTNARRLYAPEYGDILLDTTETDSSYHGFTITLDKRFTKGFSVLTSYAFGKAIDEQSTETRPQIPFRNDLERGLAGQHISHRFVASWIWELPRVGRLDSGPGANRVLGRVVNGWEFTGISIVESGHPFTVRTGADNSRSGQGQDRPNLVGREITYGNRPRGEMIAKYFDWTAYAPNEIGKFGNLGRNTLIGPGLANVDLGIFKNLAVHEARRLQFRMELFNAFNRPNFRAPGASIIAGPSSARLTSVRAPRIIQFGLKFVF